MTTVGMGRYTYKLIQDWAKLPEGESFGVVSSLATDSEDRVYVFQRKDPPIVIFDPDGNYLGAWGHGVITLPHGFSIVDDIVYLTDREDSVCLKYTLDGKPLQILGQRGVHSDTGCENPGDLVPRAAGPFNFPSEMFPSPTGDLYVSDGYRNCRIHRFSPDGQLIASWGVPGKGGPGQFHLPHSILVDQENLLYVCDRENSRIQVFTGDGEFTAMWTDMTRPNDISEGKDGNFYVAESSLQGSKPRISVRDRQGRVIAAWESRSAHGLWADSQGNVYLALTGAESVDKYLRQN
jgi:DNA-binding beta-propeller fold protein YncE